MNVGRLVPKKVGSKSSRRLKGPQKPDSAGRRPSSALVDKATLSTSSFNPESYQPLLQPVHLSTEQKSKPVSAKVLDKAQKQLDDGDRGGAYITLYKELGSEQLLVQAQITTYTGIWGSGALAGTTQAQNSGRERHNLPLDQFSTDIAQGTIDGIRKNLESGGTGRLTEPEFRAIDRDVWRQKNMVELFPGNVQFWDPWNHKKEDQAATLSQASINMARVGVRSALSLVGVKGWSGENTILQVGKRPAEFQNDPNYHTFGSKDDRFITVIDKRTGHVEAFWDNKPKFGKLPAPQLQNEALPKDSPKFVQRNFLFQKLGANQNGLEMVQQGESNPAVDGHTGWLIA